MFRFGSLFVISYLVDIWQVQAIGAIYLLFIAGNHIFRKLLFKKPVTDEVAESGTDGAVNKKKSSFWFTVLKVEVADIAFAVDSILAAVALAVALPASGLPKSEALMVDNSSSSLPVDLSVWSLCVSQLPSSLSCCIPVQDLKLQPSLS